MPSLLDFVFNKRKPIPGEWEYDIHPYFGPDTEYAVYESAPPENMPPLYQGEQGGLMDDWIPYEPTPYEEPYEYPGVEFVTRGPYDEEAGKYTSETPIGEWEIPGTGIIPDSDPGPFYGIDDPSWRPKVLGETLEDYSSTYELMKPVDVTWTKGGKTYTVKGTSGKMSPEMYESYFDYLGGEPTPLSPVDTSLIRGATIDRGGLLGIVGGGIIDPGPIYSEEEYAAHLDSLPPTTEPAPLSIAYDSYSGRPYTFYSGIPYYTGPGYSESVPPESVPPESVPPESAPVESTEHFSYVLY
jgi:hypothetical protein